MEVKGLRNGAIVSFVVSLVILFAGGYFAQKKIPPIPQKVVADGKVIMQKDDILRGQDVYQRYGLMDHGSVWGHGTLRGMDFSAYTLHMIGEAMRDFHASQGAPQAGAYRALPADKQRAIAADVIEEMHGNRYDPIAGTLTLTPAQAYAF